MYKQSWFAVSITLVMLMSVFPMVSRADLSSGLVSAWLFEEASGQVAIDSAGMNDGELLGGAARVPGMIGQAIEFNGTDSCVTIPDDATLQLPGAMTVSAWIKPTADNTDNNMGIVFKGECIAFGPNFSFKVGTRTATGMTWGRCVTDLSAEGYWFTLEVMTSDTWHHVALVCDGTTMASWFNGADISDQSTSFGGDEWRTAGPYAVYEGEPVEIGAANGWNSDCDRGFFSGLIDDVLIYDRALTGAEVEDLAGGFDMSGLVGSAVKPGVGLPITWGKIKE